MQALAVMRQFRVNCAEIIRAAMMERAGGELANAAPAIQSLATELPPMRATLAGFLGQSMLSQSSWVAA
ncbi:hypothetical protein EAY64_05190 [Aquitalea palustris]|uniref:Uncharacterized protein n=1 Tax=Aquitalea palustris TaxID=2480983 RepID=A0A454JLC0_9NEIS|nr:hypothetical protein EAY64_05190 [Aquitalea palustris]